jgi:hypothetical protein
MGSQLKDLITEQISSNISNPVLQTYSVTPTLVSGKFLSQGRIFNFQLTKQKLIYAPAGREDSTLFSALHPHNDGLLGVPTITKSRCTSISYECGKICLGLRRRCHKGITLKEDIERVSKIFTLISVGKKVGSMKEKALKHLNETDREKVVNRATKLQHSEERSAKAKELSESRKRKAPKAKTKPPKVTAAMRKATQAAIYKALN